MSKTKVEKEDSNVTIAGVKTHSNSKDYVWAFFMLFIGVLLLLNTTGVIGWSIWSYIWKFWPVFLVLWGVKLIIGNSTVANIIISVLSLLTFSMIGLFAYSSYHSEGLRFLPSGLRNAISDCSVSLYSANRGNSAENEEIVLSSEYEDIEKVNLNVELGGCELEILDTETENYLKTNSRYFENFGVPVLEKSVENGTLSMLFNIEESTRIHMLMKDTPEYILNLGEHTVPTDINIEFGAGEGNIMLENQAVGNMNVDLGAGSLIVDLSENSIPTAEMSMDIGAGSIVLNIPSNVAFVIDYSLGIGSIEYNGDEIATFAGDSIYTSENYDDADVILNISANVGVGSLEINAD